MKHESITITGAELENRWESDNRTAAEVAGLDSINPDALYEVSWPDHVLTPRYNGDCDIRLMARKKLGNLTADQAYRELINSDLNWYIVQYTDGSYDCKHRTGLSSVLECGKDPADYDIDQLHQCWNGQELGECPW